MKKTKINHVIEYSSSTLILSYFLIHNIILVQIGIILSLYLININFFNNIIRSINNNLVLQKSTTELNKYDKVTKYNYSNKESNKEDTKLTLVETIEELGFIPSIDKNDASNAV